MVKIRVVRNLRGYPFCPEMSQKDLEKVEEFLVMILALMAGKRFVLAVIEGVLKQIDWNNCCPLTPTIPLLEQKSFLL